MKGTKLFAEETPVATTGGVRHCSHPGCTTILSKYNPEDKCNLHGGGGGTLDPCPEPWKRCGKCGDHYPLKMFPLRHESGHPADYRRSFCINCERAAARERYAKKVGHAPTSGHRPRKDGLT